MPSSCAYALEESFLSRSATECIRPAATMASTSHLDYLVVCCC